MVAAARKKKSETRKPALEKLVPCVPVDMDEETMTVTLRVPKSWPDRLEALSFKYPEEEKSPQDIHRAVLQAFFEANPLTAEEIENGRRRRLGEPPLLAPPVSGLVIPGRKKESTETEGVSEAVAPLANELENELENEPLTDEPQDPVTTTDPSETNEIRTHPSGFRMPDYTRA